MTPLQCLFCDQSNPATAKFCNECGTPLHFKPCPQCDGINGRFASGCYRCGAAFSPLAADAGPVSLSPLPDVEAAALAATVPGDPWAYLAPGTEPAIGALAASDVAETGARRWGAGAKWRELHRFGRPAAVIAALALAGGSAWFVSQSAPTAVADTSAGPAVRAVTSVASTTSPAAEVRVPDPVPAIASLPASSAEPAPASLQPAVTVSEPASVAAQDLAGSPPVARTVADLPRSRSTYSAPAGTVAAKANVKNGARQPARKPARKSANNGKQSTVRVASAPSRATARPARTEGAAKAGTGKGGAGASTPQVAVPCPEVTAMLSSCDKRTLAKGN